MSNQAVDAFSELDKARWETAARTYGNDHATLIGLLVDWWISLSTADHFALEGGPGYRANAEKGRGQCDALLCCDGIPAGVLEVEGTRIKSTIDKVGGYLTSHDHDLEKIEFGIVLLYAYTPIGHGPNRHFEDPASGEVLAWLVEVSKMVREKPIILISLSKKYQKQTSLDSHVR